jgi:hypothetical protein
VGELLGFLPSLFLGLVALKRWLLLFRLDVIYPTGNIGVEGVLLELKHWLFPLLLVTDSAADDHWGLAFGPLTLDQG